jgi:activating signal cointegrator 1
MKGLSLWQPWAQLVAIGAKKIETRSWGTDYRGPLAIHATKAFPASAKNLCMGTPFMDALMCAGYSGTYELPHGAIVAVANLHRVGEIERRSDGAAGC